MQTPSPALFLRSGVIHSEGRPVIRFDSNAEAGAWMLAQGYRAFEQGGIFYFWKPEPPARSKALQWLTLAALSLFIGGAFACYF